MNRPKAKYGHSLHAFTLVEMLVVIALSSLVVLIGMLYFQNIQEYMKVSERKAEDELELMYFMSRLETDFNKAHHCTYNSFTGRLKLHSQLNEISYVFNNGQFKREGKASESIQAEDVFIEPSYVSEDSESIEFVKITIRNEQQRDYELLLFKLPEAKASFQDFLDR